MKYRITLATFFCSFLTIYPQSVRAADYISKWSAQKEAGRPVKSVVTKDKGCKVSFQEPYFGKKALESSAKENAKHRKVLADKLKFDGKVIRKRHKDHHHLYGETQGKCNKYEWKVFYIDKEDFFYSVVLIKEGVVTQIIQVDHRLITPFEVVRLIDPK